MSVASTPPLGSVGTSSPSLSDCPNPLFSSILR